MYVYIYACMYVCMYVCMHVCMYACMHVCMHVCMYACMHLPRLKRLVGPDAEDIAQEARAVQPHLPPVCAQQQKISPGRRRGATAAPSPSRVFLATRPRYLPIAAGGLLALRRWSQSAPCCAPPPCGSSKWPARGTVSPPRESARGFPSIDSRRNRHLGE